MEDFERKNIIELLSMHPKDCICCHCPTLRKLLETQVIGDT